MFAVYISRFFTLSRRAEFIEALSKGRFCFRFSHSFSVIRSQSPNPQHPFPKSMSGHDHHEFHEEAALGSI
ncbi:MAG: hypothetical protein Q8O74_02125, partial [bacterium]|nr:hypothetical protein [bacterium]